jgi:hypothetical protein
LRFSEE